MNYVQPVQVSGWLSHFSVLEETLERKNEMHGCKEKLGASVPSNASFAMHMLRPTL